MKEPEIWYSKYWLESVEKFIPTRKLNEAIIYCQKQHLSNKHITKNIFSCKIEGYTVRLVFKRFTSTENRIINFYKINQEYARDIKDNLFKEEFYDKLYSEGIFLFPSSIMDIDLNCDCNNRKIICKHIIAVLYLFAFELEERPFLLFNLKGSNITKLPIFKKEHEEEPEIIDESSQEKEDELAEIKDISDIFTRKILDNASVTDNVFLTSIPEFSNVIYSLLDNNSKSDYVDFNSLLQFAYESMNSYRIDNVEEYNLNEDDEYNAFIELDTFKTNTSTRYITRIFNKKWGYPKTWNTFNININNNYSISRIDVGVKSIFTKFKNPKILFGFLTELKDIEVPNLTREVYFLKSLYDFSLELIRKYAFIPELFKSNDKLHIRWIPPYSNPSINKIIENYSLTCPDNFITVNRKFISKKNQVIIAVSLIIKGFISNFIDNYEDELLDDYNDNLLFKLLFVDAQKISLFKEGEIDNINDWLNPLDIKQSEYELSLIITEEDDYFNVEIKVSIDKDDEIYIHEVFTNSSDEYLLQRLENDLKTIYNISPELEKLKSSESIHISSNDFSNFFNEQLPLLESLGLKITVPSFLNNKIHPTLELNIRNISSNKTYLSIDDLMEFDWNVAVGEDKYSINKFKEVTDNHNNLIKTSDNYIILDSDDMKYINKQIDNIPEKISGYDLIKVIVSGEINNIKVKVDENIRKMITHANNVKTDLPKGLNADLREYQIVGFNWLVQNLKSGFGSILADDMGLGKTLQVLTLIQYLKEENHLDKSNVLVIAPTSVLSNWKKEIEKFTPELSCIIYHGPYRELTHDTDIILTSYGIIREDYEIIGKKEWLLVVLDEAQNIKNNNTKQTRAIKSIHSRYKVALTGTPIENRLSEYWSIFDFVNHGYLYSLREFNKRYVSPIEKERDENILDNFKTITQPFILRRLKSDSEIIQDLPEKNSNDIYCNLTSNQAKLYEDTLNEYMESIKYEEGIARKGKIFKLINSLKQICNHPSQYTKSNIIDMNDSGKMHLLIDTLETIFDNDEKVLIFTQYVQMGKILERSLEEHFNKEVLFLHGSLSRKRRDELISKFQDSDDNHIFIISLKAGGTGVNLTAATNVIHYDLWWNPAVENQATDRAYRIGQTKNVMVYRLITTGTFEERINDMIMDKNELAEITISNGGSFITQMSDDKLREMLKLR